MSSGFITEAEISEARKRRQEEWEKVRTSEQPLERPEEPYDGRSLFDRLKEQKLKKDLDYEETHKLKNLIRGLDDDEIQFLELADKNKINMEKKQMQEEEKELKEFRTRVTTLQEELMDKKLQNELKLKQKPQTSSSSSSTARPTQKSLLGIGIKRKNGEAVPTSTKNKETDSVNPISPEKTDPTAQSIAEAKRKTLKNIEIDGLDKGLFKCVAILPGLGPYTESSDSEISSDSGDEPYSSQDFGKYDLVGRKHPKKKPCVDER
uniref:Nefa_Nip30_N domain-containing protein n=1 Tax=Glossina brevipalpis TaxID=37001 RepID=A0A1A9WDT6_9MUSC